MPLHLPLGQKFADGTWGNVAPTPIMVSQFADLSGFTTLAGTPVIASGTLQLGHNGTVGDKITSTAQNLDLTNKYFLIENTQYGAAYRETFVGLTGPAGNPFGTADLGFFFSGVGTGVNVHVNGADTGITFNQGAAARWLRIREHDGYVAFEYGATETGVFTQVHTVATPAWATACQVYLGVEFATTLDPVSTWDNLGGSTAVTNHTLSLSETPTISDVAAAPTEIANTLLFPGSVYSSIGTGTGTHDPGSGVTPKAVVVQIAQHAGGADQISGVTYGGVAMTKLRVDIQTAGSVDPVVYTFVLTEGIPTGSQTVAVTTTGTSQKYGRVRSLAAPGPVEVNTHTGSIGTTGAPTLSMATTSGRNTYVLAALCSQADTPVLTGTGVITANTSYDYGNEIALFGSGSGETDGSTAVGFDAANADAQGWALSAVALGGVGVQTSKGTLSTIGDTPSIADATTPASGKATSVPDTATVADAQALGQGKAVAETPAITDTIYPLSAYDKEVFIDNPRSWFKLDGTTPIDTMGVATSVSDLGGLTWSQTGIVDNNFSRTSLRLTRPAASNPVMGIGFVATGVDADLYSLEIWFKVNSIGNTTSPNLFVSQYGGIYLDGASGYIAGWSADGTFATLNYLVSSTPVGTGRHHAVLDVNGAEWWLYLDGVEVMHNATSRTARTDDTNWGIGSYPYQSDGFDGWVSQAALYDHNLGPTRVLAHAVAGGLGGSTNYTPSINDTATVADAIALNRALTQADTATIADAQALSQAKVQADTATIADAQAFAQGKVLAETPSMGDSITPVSGDFVTLNETPAVADNQVNVIGRFSTLGETPSIADNSVAAIVKLQAFNDTATIRDNSGPRKGVNSSNSWYISDADQDSENALLATAGNEWVRYQIEWDDILTSSSSSYYWTTYDETILNATNAGFKVLVTVLNTPSWARSGGDVRTPPTLDSDYAAICATIADRWDGTGGQGKIDALQVWNEPNNGTRFWTGTVAKYTSMAIAAYDAVKAVRPDVKVGTCVATLGLANYLTWLQDMYTGGIEGKQDFVGIHVYTTGGTPVADSQFARFITLHDEMVAQGDPAEVWITEFGWNTSALVFNGADIWQGGNTQSTVAAYLDAAWQIFAFYPWVKNAFYYMARDYNFGAGTPESYFGLLESNFTPKTAYSTFATLGPLLIESGKGSAVNDTASIADSITPVSAFQRPQADSASITDAQALARALLQADSASIADANSLAQAKAVNDGATIADNTVMAGAFQRPVNDTATIVDAQILGQGKGVDDTATIVDNASVGGDKLQPVNDTASIADNQSLGIGYFPAVINDTASMTDAQSFAQNKQVDDAATMADRVIGAWADIVTYDTDAVLWARFADPSNASPPQELIDNRGSAWSNGASIIFDQGTPLGKGVKTTANWTANFSPYAAMRTDDFTVECFAYFPAGPIDALRVTPMAAVSQAANNWQGYSIIALRQNTIASPWSMQFNVLANPQVFTQINTSTFVPGWHHVVCSRAADGSALVILDGVTVASRTAGQVPYTPNTTLSTWAAGASAPDSIVDELVMYDRALTLTEAQERYAAIYSIPVLKYQGISDTLTRSDSTTTSVGVASQVDDTAMIADDFAPAIILLNQLTETPSITDSVSTFAQYFQSYNENPSITDNMTSFGAFQRSIPDTMTIGDNNSALIILLKNVDDTMSIADVVAMARAQMQADSLTIVDNVSRLYVGQRGVVETIGLGETPSRTIALVPRTASETMVINDVLTRNAQTRSRGVTETITINEVATPSAGGQRSVADAISVSETPTRFVSLPRLITESLSLGEIATRTQGQTRGVADPIDLAESLVFIPAGTRDVFESISISENIESGTSRSVTASDDLVLSELTSRSQILVPRITVDSITIIDSTGRDVASNQSLGTTKVFGSAGKPRMVGHMGGPRAYAQRPRERVKASLTTPDE